MQQGFVYCYVKMGLSQVESLKGALEEVPRPRPSGFPDSHTQPSQRPPERTGGPGGGDLLIPSPPYAPGHGQLCPALPTAKPTASEQLTNGIEVAGSHQPS